MPRHTVDDTIVFDPALRENTLGLEEPGKITDLLREYVSHERFDRMESILSQRTRRLTALLENVSNPHNVAACLRSCDAFGIQDLHVVTEGSQPIRVARGIARKCHKWLTVHHHADLESAIAAIRRAGYSIAATDPGSDVQQAMPLQKVPMEDKLCVAFGNEADGVSPELRQAADFLMVIPMHGFVESLNISVAFALSMHWLRTKLDTTRGTAGDLTDSEKVRLVDRWVLEQVSRSQEVLAELDRRKRAAETAQ